MYTRLAFGGRSENRTRLHRFAICDLTIRTSDHFCADILQSDMYSCCIQLTSPTHSYIHLKHPMAVQSTQLCQSYWTKQYGGLISTDVLEHKSGERGNRTPIESNLPDVTAIPTLRYTSPFSRVFPRCPSLLEIPFYLLLRQGLCTHTTTILYRERYVSISSPTLTPTRANGYVGENQKVCCRGRNRTYGCLQNQNLTCRLYTTRQCDFRNCTGNLWLT